MTYRDLDASRQSCKYLYAAPMAMIAANADKLVQAKDGCNIILTMAPIPCILLIPRVGFLVQLQ